MGTFLIRTVKDGSAIPMMLFQYDRHFQRIKSGVQTVESLVPVIGGYNAIKGNDYLIDVKNENTETLRYIANTIIRSETCLHSQHYYPFLIIYALEDGKEIDTETQMFTMFNLDRTNKPSGITYTTPPGLYIFKNDVLQTWRGDPHYYPVKQYDSPHHFTQKILDYRTPQIPISTNANPFMGLSVAWGRETGKALKHVYFRVSDASNYHLSDRGNIVLHDRGNLRDGRLKAFHKYLSPIYPLFSPRIFDNEGKLVECKRVTDTGKAHLISEYKMKRVKEYAKGGAVGIFAKHLITLIDDFAKHYCEMNNEIAASVHNLNYDVKGYEKTKSLYQRAEHILRRIAEYFPNQLTFDQSKRDNSQPYETLPTQLRLRLEGDVESAQKCWDYLVFYVEWFRRNYVAYDTPPQQDAPCSFRFYGTVGPYDEEAEGLDANSYLAENHSWTWRKTRLETKFGSPRVDDGLSAQRDVLAIEYNDWLADTRGTAADIEQSGLTFPANALQFINLLCHFQKVCNPRPYIDAPRVKGPLPGELVRSERIKKNARNINVKPASPPPLRPPAPAERVIDVALPNFAPLQWDARAVIKRCANDVADEQDAEDEDPAPDADEAARERFAAQQDCLEFQRMKKGKAKKAVWRNEIDPIDPEDLAREEADMWEKAANNVEAVVETAENIIDVVTVIGAPISGPEVAGKRLITKTIRKRAKKSIKRLLERSIDAARDLPDPDAPDYDENAPKEGNPPDPKNETPDPCQDIPPAPQQYEPPDLQDDPEFTGDEDYCRHAIEWEDAPWRTTYAGNRMQWPWESPEFPQPVYDRHILEQISPKRGRRLVQRNILKFDEAQTGFGDVTVQNGARLPTENARDAGQERLFCRREPPRLPRN